jgi:predicted lipoprotein with Yx(FWY)xxD motif
MTRDRRMTLLAMCIAALAAAGCGGSNSGNSGSAAGTPPKTSDGRAATIGVENSGLGQILEDSKGRTVYLFQKDTGTTSTCTGACASAWPPVLVSGKPVVGNRANPSEVGSTKRTDGGRQVTYNGHPLYTYTGDQKPGDVNGQGLNAFGGRWFALSPAGDQVSGSAPTSGSGGY